MKDVFTWLGVVFAFGVLLIAGSAVLTALLDKWEHRKEMRHVRHLKAILDSVARYCCHEYPQAAMLADEVVRALDNNTGIRAMEFRERLRERFPLKDKKVDIDNV